MHAHEKQTLAMAERAEPVRLAQARVREVQQQWQRNCQEIAQAVEALQACRDDIVTQQARQVDPRRWLSMRAVKPIVVNTVCIKRYNPGSRACRPEFSPERNP